MASAGELIARLAEDDALISAVFGNKRKKSEALKKVSLRPVLIKDVLCYQAEYHYEKKVTHENLMAEELGAFTERLIESSFKQLDVFSKDGDYTVLASKPENQRISKKAPTKTINCNLMHNRERAYIIPEGKPCDFLIRLGVMTKDGQIVPKHRNKFRQINRFLEIAEDCLKYLPENPTIIDFGCGKSYLTFALYYYLNVMKDYGANLVGLDLKDDVISFCNEVAKDLGYDKLSFKIGDIADYDETAKADMVVTLHACDTATDFALMKASVWNASVILSVPCCQHEVNHQIDCPEQDAILRHGILKERISAIITDALRALKLREAGYKVDMIEFTSLEHTAKNIMLRCLKGGVSLSERKKAREEFEQQCSYWGIEPTIKDLKTGL